MDALNEIIAKLEKQKQAIDTALAALRGAENEAPAESPRVKRTYTRRAAVKKRRGISEEGRQRLADAMKKRWAAKRTGSAVKKGRKKAAAKKAE